MRTAVFALLAALSLTWSTAHSADDLPVANGRKLNNLVSVLLEAPAVAKSDDSLAFTRSRDGWIFVSADVRGSGSLTIVLDPAALAGGTVLIQHATASETAEAVRHVAGGEHHLRVELEGDARLENLVVKSIPELVHCGLGFDAAIKSYPRYTLDFLKPDVLPNVTTLIVPHNIQLEQAVIDDWHRAGKRFVAEVGINSQAQTADEHFQFWTGFLDKAPFIDGIIINEFIMNKLEDSPRGERLRASHARHQQYEQALARIRADERYKDKRIFAYIGGSGNFLNYDNTSPTFVRQVIDCDYRIALERYIFERSSPEGSQQALQRFIDGIADWEAKEPAARQHMVIAFGLFSMPPGGINKLPKVDYHVWMDQQMQVVANDPALADIAGLEWWTSILADEETVRFVGKLYRHYAIEGRTEMLTADPLFMTHLQNADFENGTTGWMLEPAEAGSIEPKSFPRAYGRIEGRYMGLGRPADPEHIGDTFLWMKRSQQGPNTFSQTIQDLEPGRLYSLKMLSCDYGDLVEPKAKTEAEANKFLGQVILDGVEIDASRSFREAYASNPEPKIPVWITYHWFVFRATAPTAKLTVSDWESATPSGPFGQEQTFNFLELQPYHE